MLCNDDFINKSSNKIAPSSILRICENAQKINFPNLSKFSHNSARAQKPTSNVYIKLKINVLQPLYQASQPTHQPAAYLIMLLMVFNEWLQHYGVTLLFRKWEFLKCITLANCTQLFNQDIAFGPDEMMFSSKNQIKMFLIIFEKFKLRLSVDLWAQGKRTTKKKLHRHRPITSLWLFLEVVSLVFSWVVHISEYLHISNHNYNVRAL